MSYTLHLYDAGDGLSEAKDPISTARVDTLEEAKEVRQWLRGLEFSEDRKLADAARSLYLVVEHVPDVTTALAAKERLIGSDAFREVDPGARKEAARRRQYTN